MVDKQDGILRKQLVDLLEQGNAHADFDKAVGGLPHELRGQRPSASEHSAWELVEHMRIAQRDILAFIRDPEYVSPEFPSGYWPQDPAPKAAGDWEKSVHGFRSDRAAFVKLIRDPEVDLLRPLPQGQGQPILQKALLTADHNAYHLGQLVLVRRLLGAWK